MDGTTTEDKNCQNNNSKECDQQSKDNQSEDDMQSCKTPLPGSSDLKSLPAWAHHVTDSGFSSAQRSCLSRSSTSAGSSSLQSSPEPDRKLPGGRRVTLAHCDFSPVTRESFSVIRSRKLSFHNSDLLPPPSRIEFSEAASARYENERNKQEQNKVSLSAEDLVRSLSPVSPGLFSFEKEVLHRRVARLSSEEISLESSLQDMSLDECSSSSSSGSNSISRSSTPEMALMLSSGTSIQHRPVETVPLTSSHKPICRRKEGMMQPEMDSCVASKRTSTSSVNLDQLKAINIESQEPFDTDTFKAKNITAETDGCKSDFMNVLQLVSASTSSSLTCCDSLKSLPLSLSQSTPFEAKQTSSQHIPVTQANLVTQIITPAALDPSRLAVSDTSCTLEECSLSKSPCKRTGSRPVEIDLLFSPNKSRRTDYLCIPTSPAKLAARNIFPDEEPSLCQGHFFQQPKSQEPQEERLPCFTPLHSSGHSGQCAHRPASSHESYDSATSNSHGCVSCVRKAALTVDPLPEKLLGVIQEMTPREPSRLIGRHVGVLKFDIIAGLGQNFSLCLSRILGLLEVEDLVAVSNVSYLWRQALKNDKLSYTRYRHHLSEISRRKAVLAGQFKENVVEKPIEDSALFTPMIKSKGGCLSDLQAKAEETAPQAHAVKINPQPSGQSSLKWGDQLRHCPRCQHPALVRPHEGRAACTHPTCQFDFCTQCFAAYHHPRPCKPLSRSLSKGDVAGNQKSKRSLRRL